ncbi:MAG TPA: HEAT repeat domain-containing protein [Methanosarcina sp.]
MARVFVSSTFKDLEECREKVRLNLKRMRHEDIAMEYFIAEDKRPVDKCLGDVASCDLYIGVFAWRYGYTPEGYGKSITELEYRKAVKAGKECLIFLLHEDAPWPPKYVDKGKDAEKIAALRNELSTKYIVSFFKSADELSSLVGAAIHQWETQNKSSVLEEGKIAELDLTQYKEAVSKRYCNIDLDALTPSKKEDYLKIKLSSVFVEQNVRENPPPVELPKEILNKMHEEWDPEKECFPEGLTAEDLKRAKESYYSKDSKSVLDVISDEKNRFIVILGDPGAGKSTLTKYIILSVLQLNDDEKLLSFFNSYLPLRVELREFAGLCAEKDCKTFLDYFQHLSETEGYSLTKEEVDNYLKNDGKAIIIFDGLDEIFDPKEWERINRMIVGFTLDYPKVRVIVTSRIIGYKRKILDDAGFVHFTLQDFEKEQIENFLDKWYPFVVDENEIENRKSRILKALKDSPSIRQLAGNPLLLTILAIIGKHQELPRERWKLYDHAASVLVENWEVNKHLKRSSVEMDFIGEDDKKELLMKIAFKMQSGPDGLAGNFIHRKTLQQEIEVYLQNRYQKDPSDSKEIAVSIIDQLRRVNFILCLYGADFYGFVHRTFLEYFCAMDIVQKFDNHALNIETLKLNYFEKYWEDPTWHEVLSLVCGMKEKFADDIIKCLMQIYDPQYFGNRPPLNIVLAIKCLSEIRNPNAIGDTAKKLLERVLRLFEMVRWTQDINQFLAEEVVPAAKLVGDRWPNRDIIIDQFSQSQAYMRYYSFLIPPDIDIDLNNTWAEFITGVNSKSKKLHEEALRKITNKAYSSLLGVLVLGKYESKDGDLFRLFYVSAQSRFYFVRSTAVQELASGWHDDPETIRFIKRATNDESLTVRITAVQELARGWHDDPETINIIKQRATNDENNYVRSTAVQELASGWHDDPETIRFIKQRATKDNHWEVRRSAVQELASGWHDDPETIRFIKRATNDKNNDVRSTAVQELARGWHDDPETIRFIKRATNDKNNDVRSTAVQELARGWHDDPETINIIKQWATNDKDKNVRSTAVQELAREWHDDPETINIIKQWATNDKDKNVRITVVQELASGWHDDPETINIIKQRATNDDHWEVRITAAQELASGWHDDPETINIIKQRATNDENNYVRITAVQELASGWHDGPETIRFIKQRATKDNHWEVRRSAVQELASGWHDDSETINIIKQRITNDDHWEVRGTAVQELASGWHDDPETINIIKQRATNDEDNDVRRSAVKK